MDETANVGVTEEMATPEVSQSAAQETTTQDIVETKQDRDWKSLRRAKDELERKNRLQDELIHRLMSHQQVAPVQQPQIDELDSIPDDDYIPKGKVKALLKRTEDRAEKIAEEAVNKALQQQENAQAMPRLKQKYTDFDDVVTPENLSLLEEQDPELAKTIAEIKDPYKIGLQAYKFIKALRIAESAPASRRDKEVAKAIEKNNKTVQTPQAFDKRPMAQAFKASQADLDSIYREMMDCASKSGGRY